MSEVSNERTQRLEREINRQLEEATSLHGFDIAQGMIPSVVGEVAPGWDYVDTTFFGGPPTIALTVQW